jgi:predicted heme/steroid binding protein
MQIEDPESEPVFSLRQLSLYTGERVHPMYIAYEGIVYDVTHCPKWRRGLHENLHWPGQDLTVEIKDAPHSDSVFEHACARRVGRLAST